MSKFKFLFKNHKIRSTRRFVFITAAVYTNYSDSIPLFLFCSSFVFHFCRFSVCFISILLFWISPFQPRDAFLITFCVCVFLFSSPIFLLLLALFSLSAKKERKKEALHEKQKACHINNKSWRVAHEKTETTKEKT